MRRGGGKNKGSSFERLVCVQLSLWITKGAQEDVYWRAAMSGGRATVAHKKGKRLAAQAGDISCIHSIGEPLTDKFMLECKFYADLNYIGLLVGRGKLASFWTEAKTQAARYGKLPLLIAKQNQQPIVVCLSREGLDVLNVRLKCSLTAPKLNLFMVLFDDFLKHAGLANGK